MSESYDCEMRDALVCPACGHAETDSWEYFRDDEDGTVSCGSCGVDYYASRIVSVYYTTRIIEPAKGEEG